MDFAPYTLRPFRPSDEAGVIALVAGCYAEYAEVIELDTLDADLLEIGRAYPDPDSCFRVLVDGARIVGSVAIRSKDATEAELKRVFLERSLRGRGLGKKLTRWAFDWAAAHGFEIVHIWSDARYETAHALYRRLGAEETGVRRHLGGRNRCDEKYFLKRLAR